MKDDDKLTVAEIAELSGISASDWRTRVSRGRAPAPDYPDLGRNLRRREPKWKYSTWLEWENNRVRRVGV